MWRPAAESDDARIIELCVALNREDPGPDPVPPAHMARTLQMLREQAARGCALALEMNGAVQGYALIISFWSNELGGEVGIVDELYVAATARGQGHATRLLESLAKGTVVGLPAYTALTLEVRPDNARARRLYERVGFTATNTVMRRRVAR